MLDGTVGEGGPVSDAVPDSHTKEEPCATIVRAARTSGGVTIDVTMRMEALWGTVEEEEAEGDEEENLVCLHFYFSTLSCLFPLFNTSSSSGRRG